MPFVCLSSFRYQLLLRDLVRYTEKGLDILARRSSDDDVSANAAATANTDHLRSSLQDEVDTLSRALHIMTIVPKMANDMMMVGRLQGFDVRIFVTFSFILGTCPTQRDQWIIHLSVFSFFFYVSFFSPSFVGCLSLTRLVSTTQYSWQPNRVK